MNQTGQKGQCGKILILRKPLLNSGFFHSKVLVSRRRQSADSWWLCSDLQGKEEFVLFTKCIIEHSFRHLEAEMEEAQGELRRASMLFPWKGDFLAHYQTASADRRKYLSGMHGTKMYFAFKNE